MPCVSNDHDNYVCADNDKYNHYDNDDNYRCANYYEYHNYDDFWNANIPTPRPTRATLTPTEFD